MKPESNKSLSPSAPPRTNDLEQPGEPAEDRGGSVGLVQTQTIRLFTDQPLQLECGRSLGPIDVAYETYGVLNDRRDNAILIFHALSGDAHLAGRHQPEDPKPGWWDIMVGPGKPFDTDRYFVICSNCLGGCMGTTGPSSIDPRTNEPYGLGFPMITISDMVDVQRHLIDRLGIEKLLAVAGGSMGGMQVLDWAIRYPHRVAAALPIATTSRLTAQGIAFDAVGRNAILTDRNFQDGAYYRSEIYPSAGLAVARMIGHITYLSEEAMHAKFGRRLQNARDYKYDFENEFSVETYLDHQGTAFVDRFDANTYLYFSKAMDYFDLCREQSDLIQAMSRTQCRFLVVSFDSDWLFPPRQSREIVNALLAAHKDVTYCDIDCPFGHDSFLLETKVQGRLITGFLRETHAMLRGVRPGAGKSLAPPPPRPSALSRLRRGSIFAGERVDHHQIARLIDPDSSVLDLGCGNGDLLALLHQSKNIRGMGVTLGEEDIVRCAERGLSVVQYDLDKGLTPFADKSYHYVVLSQTLPVIRRPDAVIREMLRIGRRVIVSFPNFAYWRARLQMLIEGRAPIWKGLPYPWYDKPSINFLSITDFETFLRDQLRARLVRRIPLSSRRRRQVDVLPNFFADEAIFVIADAEHE